MSNDVLFYRLFALLLVIKIRQRRAIVYGTPATQGERYRIIILV